MKPFFWPHMPHQLLPRFSSFCKTSQKSCSHIVSNCHSLKVTQNETSAQVPSTRILCASKFNGQFSVLIFFCSTLWHTFPTPSYSFLDSAFRILRSLGFLATSLGTHPQFTLLIFPLHLNLLQLEFSRVMPSWFAFSISTQHLTNLSFKYQLLDVQMTPQYTSQKPSSPPTPHSYSIQMPASNSVCMSNWCLKFHISEIMLPLSPTTKSSPVNSSSVLPWLKSKTLWSSLTTLPYIQSRNPNGSAFKTNSKSDYFLLPPFLPP